jgi:ATP-dependent helicase Lhr and Lhr-like helicase
LAQQVVAEVAATDPDTPWREDDLYGLARRAWPYRHLRRADFDAVMHMLGEGFRTERRWRRGLLHRDEVHGRVRARRGARLTAITSGGTIPDNADYDVLLEPEEIRVGSVNEDFAVESMAGDIFQLGNASYRIVKVEPGRVRVVDARGEPPTLPFWLGEAWPRSDALSHAVSSLRERVEGGEPLDELPEAARRQLLEYLEASQAALGALPTRRRLVLERFFDEMGNAHLVIHSPFGTRINRAFGLALRKRFCRRFNQELQAAATDDAVVLSLGPVHSFDLDEVWRFLHPNTVRPLLAQAVLDAPLFETRWRWNATRALAVLRFRGGKKVAAPLQRMEAADLLATIFPEQAACLENMVGDREVPDHPLVGQTLNDCLTEALDVDGLERLLRDLASGEVLRVSCDLTEPSPLAQEILNARPYAFLDDAPLEERRTQAVRSRRWLGAEQAASLGALDPQAIARVVDEVRPDPRDTEELHDALVLGGALAPCLEWRPWLEALAAQGRAGELEARGTRWWVAAERIHQWRAVHPQGRVRPHLEPPRSSLGPTASRDEALRELVRARMDAAGPVTAGEVAAALGVGEGDAKAALHALEGEGAVLRGHFRTGAATEEWCERRLLARIHRLTLGRLRAEIEPVSAAAFMRFLVRWQHADMDTRMEGPEGLAAVLDQLGGFEAAAQAWEADLLPLRMRDYDPAWLDGLCLSGRMAWARRTAKRGTGVAGRSRARGAPVALMPRGSLALWLADAADANGEATLTPDALSALTWLEAHGASFFDDVARGTGLLRSRLEGALGELVAHGRVTADGFGGLRSLLASTRSASTSRAAPRRRRRLTASGMEAAGRWAALPRTRGATDAEHALEELAWALLRRWGVVFRRVLEREAGLPPWRELVRVCRRLEAQGRIRGGRFVAGFSGEQYALPEAVPMLRQARREEGRGHLVTLSGADPLNLVGIVLPGERVPALARNRVLLRDGVTVATRRGSVVQVRDEEPQDQRWSMETALVRQPQRTPPSHAP